jgi:hypothetical protein
MFTSTVRRIAVVALAAPALLVATAVVASAAEHQAADGHGHHASHDGWSGDSSFAYYHQSGAAANAWGAATGTTNAATGNHNGHGFAWSDQTMATATPWGADAGHTTSYATYGNGNWGDHSDWRDGSAGFSNSAAHAGADGASAGDVAAGATN